jgi:hypothetical protein
MGNDWLGRGEGLFVEAYQKVQVIVLLLTLGGHRVYLTRRRMASFYTIFTRAVYKVSKAVTYWRVAPSEHFFRLLLLTSATRP